MKGNHLRPHIGIFGNTNQGKSTLVNDLLNQNNSIVSEIAGTTTDPIKKTMELFGVGPIVLIDTAGINDDSFLGIERKRKTENMVDQIDFALLLISNNEISDEALKLLNRFQQENIPYLVIHSKNDIQPLSDEFNKLFALEYSINPIPYEHHNKEMQAGIEDAIVQKMPASAYTSSSLFANIIKPNDLVLLVTPIDSEAPEGRLILPQVQAIRSILDERATCVVLQDSELDYFIHSRGIEPNLIITDSQVFGKVNEIVPPHIPLTSFSILLAYHKGDFSSYMKGTSKLSKLHDGDRILILESCTHQVSCDDIGRVKIPNWINQFSKKQLKYDIVSGLDTPQSDLNEYALIIQCGACMITQNQLKKRLRRAVSEGIPITNYGLAIAYIHEIYDRVVAPFNLDK